MSIPRGKVCRYRGRWLPIHFIPTIYIMRLKTPGQFLCNLTHLRYTVNTIVYGGSDH